MNGFKLDTKNTTILILVMIGVFSFWILGMVSFKTIIGALFLFLVPFYLILNRTNLPINEKVIFSFFLGIGFFPSIVYYLGFFLGIRKSIITTFIVLTIVGIIINMIKKENLEKSF